VATGEVAVGGLLMVFVSVMPAPPLSRLDFETERRRSSDQGK
jgi:hypothetical protein